MPAIKDIRPLKTRLRKECIEARRALDPREKASMDERIAQKLRHLWIYRESDIIYTYVSTEIEADTRGIIKMAVLDGKAVAVPRCIKGTREMEFCIIKSEEDLESGAFGVLEPKESCPVCKDFSGGLCIVPALSFDSSGFRLGYGKGYYDRFLAKFGGKTAGLCYSAFIRPELPRGKFDKAVDVIITERSVTSVL